MLPSCTMLKPHYETTKTGVMDTKGSLTYSAVPAALGYTTEINHHRRLVLRLTLKTHARFSSLIDTRKNKISVRLNSLSTFMAVSILVRNLTGRYNERCYPLCRGTRVHFMILQALNTGIIEKSNVSLRL